MWAVEIFQGARVARLAELCSARTGLRPVPPGLCHFPRRIGDQLGGWTLDRNQGSRFVPGGVGALSERLVAASGEPDYAALLLLDVALVP
jgi:hypothetical protein